MQDEKRDGSRGALTEPSAQTLAYIEKQDAALNKRAGYSQDAIGNYVRELIAHGRVEVGWRESCGTTDPTHRNYRAWLKVLPKLKKDGLAITEERQKHKNGWATKSGGFWNSIVYVLERNALGGAVSAEPSKSSSPSPSSPTPFPNLEHP